ncbi:MAG: chemotaxis protein CheD [Melioribacteraceae bacterium]
MKPDLSGLTSIYLQPGEACFSSNPVVVNTVLGSCLSITMFSEKIKYAGMSHCQLPYSKHCNLQCNDCKEPYKFVKCTIIQMIKKFEAMQIQRKDIEVKIFGGADVLKTTITEDRISTVGRQNIDMALETLANFNMTVTASDIGGRFGRKMHFVTDTGEIFLNRLNNNG